MLRHNLLPMFRNFKRYKSTYFINPIGLSTRLACTLLIFLWVKYELSVDKFHEKDNPLYQVIIGTGALAFLIALLTVSFQAIKAAIANPVKSLRTE